MLAGDRPGRPGWIWGAISSSPAPARDAEGGEKVVHENLNAREAYQFWQEEKQGELK